MNRQTKQKLFRLSLIKLLEKLTKGIIQLKIIIEGKIYKNLRYENIPILWRKIFVRIASERDNRLIRYDELYRERHFFTI